MKYDKEEKAIIDAYEKGRMKLSTSVKKGDRSYKGDGKKNIGQEQTNNHTSLRP